MTILRKTALCISLVTATVIALPASADTTKATCDVREKGKEIYNESGDCTFSQRQGTVTIRLRNNEVYTLRPGNKSNHYKDQKGRDVKRKMEGDSHVYNWNHRHITVSFDRRHHNNSYRNEERGDPEAGFAEWQAEQDRNHGIPEIFMGRNGEGEVSFNNNCVVYYNSRGQRTSKNNNCKSGQGRTADDAMQRHRREQGY